jgi:BirA family transcriptional regulator, biotin operon repressor / biotin---[acetyl-CoA-carboxylase] ligase
MPATLSDYQGAVRRALPSFFAPVEVAASLPSTMVRAAELAAAGAPEGATVVADAQSAGRGRLGRAWLAPAGSSLLLTVVLRPRLVPEQAWLTVAAAGVALVDATAALLVRAAAEPPAVGLKWPNDLLVGGRKAAGMLAEARSEGHRLGWVLLGMGVNVGQRAGDFPAELAARATSLRLAARGEVDRVALLGAWGERFAGGYRVLAAGETDRTLAAYLERLDTLGRPVRAELLGGQAVEGVAVGVGAGGALTVRTAAGAEVAVSSGDVEHVRVLPEDRPGRPHLP